MLKKSFVILNEMRRERHLYISLRLYI